MRFTPALPAAGTYTVYLRWTAHANRASNVPVDIVHTGGITNRVVDQRVRRQWVSLGAYAFAAGTGRQRADPHRGDQRLRRRRRRPLRGRLSGGG